jgi:hypothetical protein
MGCRRLHLLTAQGYNVHYRSHLEAHRGEALRELPDLVAQLDELGELLGAVLQRRLEVLHLGSHLQNAYTSHSY